MPHSHRLGPATAPFLLIHYVIFDGEDERDNDAPGNLAHLRSPEGQKEAGCAYVSKVIESEPHG